MSKHTRDTETEWRQGYSSDARRPMANVTSDREVTVWLPDALAEEIEAEVGAGRYCSVSDAIEEAIAEFVSDEDQEVGDDV